eukprot:1159201-Pelagomonas_calceolata.AAC.3
MDRDAGGQVLRDPHSGIHTLCGRGCWWTGADGQVLRDSHSGIHAQGCALDSQESFAEVIGLLCSSSSCMRPYHRQAASVLGQGIPKTKEQAAHLSQIRVSAAPTIHRDCMHARAPPRPHTNIHTHRHVQWLQR